MSYLVCFIRTESEVSLFTSLFFNFAEFLICQADKGSVFCSVAMWPGLNSCLWTGCSSFMTHNAAVLLHPPPLHLSPSTLSLFLSSPLLPLRLLSSFTSAFSLPHSHRPRHAVITCTKRALSCVITVLSERGWRLWFESQGYKDSVCMTGWWSVKKMFLIATHGGNTF